MKRNLTKSEIEDLLDFIEPQIGIPPESATSIVNLTKERLKKQLEKHEIYPRMIPSLKKELIEYYKTSLIHPGESVGIICAQSLGEKQTQNSVSYDDKVLVRRNGKIYDVKIGEMIDEELCHGIHYELGDESYIKKVNNIEILTISQSENIEWKFVSEISRHPVNGKLIKVETESGREVTTTLAHSHLKKVDWGIEPILGSELRVGNRIPVIRKMPHDITEINWLQEYVQMFLNLNESEDKKYCDLESFRCVLTYFGIFSRIHENKIQIADFSNGKFIELFDVFPETYKSSCVYCETSDVVWEKIVKITVLDEGDYKHAYVYDFSVEGNETFAMFSGIVVHNTLNTFHKTGQSEKSVVAGVPRMNELLNATRDPKCVNSKIFFKKRHADIKDLKNTMNHQILELTFGKLCDKFKIEMNKAEEKWYKPFQLLYKNEDWYKDISKYEHCISMEMNIDILFEYKLTFDKIAEIVESQYDDCGCIFSPINLKQFHIFIDTSNISLPEDRILFITADNAKEIYLEEVVQPIFEKMIIVGIAGIKEVYYLKENDEWLVETDGSNFIKLLIHPEIDETRTVSNNIWDIYNVLGVEAVKQFLIDEFVSIMEGINICHVKLLVERMTFAGSIASISRYTMRKDEGSCLSRVSFEESYDQFCKAGTLGEVEPTKGVSASIICGKRGNFGTGMLELLVDVNSLPKVFKI
jgi:DNA-directed RNA polymerase beta' subunit